MSEVGSDQKSSCFMSNLLCDCYIMICYNFLTTDYVMIGQDLVRIGWIR